ncbi:MAG: XRE family transcriptional regulator [Planctomycetaceae bacterium]|nr:XRE family transcriptional regulator [Planctomycetaceae bacterium]
MEAATAEPLNQLVCERVRSLRKSKSLTLEQLASLSGVSRSMLSQIERGAANPTLGVAFRIAQAFGMKLGDLVDVPSPAGRIDVVRAADRSSLFRDDEQCRIRTLSPLHLEKDVEFYELTLKVGGSLVSAPHFEGTREFLTVEQGYLRVTSGEESTELKQGDSAHYPADVPHRIDNLHAGETLAFLVDIYGRPGRR